MALKTNDTIWQLYQPNNKLVNDISEKFKISKLTSSVLINRNKKDFGEIEKFLKPSFKDLYSPFLFNDMKRAVNRIISAVNSKKLIIIYGDYDVDGVTSTSILYNYLESIGANVTYYLPNRFEEGYGLNIEAVDKLSEKNPDLIITVDCGIASVNEIEFLNKKGIDTIVTDHHECPEILPNAFAIINPKRKDSTYPFNYLCGAGVAFKLVQAIKNTIDSNEDLPLEYMDLLCLATIADIVPLVDENRVFVSMGLEYIEKTSNMGLKRLIEIAGIKEITTFGVGFGLAPRINAAGRMGTANRAVEMFTTKDKHKAEKLAEELDTENKNRQSIEHELTEKIIEKIEAEKLYDDNVIVIDGECWHHGIIGIIASKLVDRYYKPCIILSFDGDIGTGSCRSIEGIDIFKLLTETSDLLVKFGGHELAAGLSIERSKLDEFRKRVNEIVSKNIDSKVFNKKFNVDYIISSKDLNLQIMDELKKIEPYGSDNPQPIFGIACCKIQDIVTLSEGKHLKIRCEINDKILYCIGFGMGELIDKFKNGQKVGMIGNLSLNEFNGNVSVQFILKDIKKI